MLNDDESQLILNSPTSSDGEANSIINGNSEVGFVFPNVKLKKTPVHQVRRPLIERKIWPFFVFHRKIARKNKGKSTLHVSKLESTWQDKVEFYQ